MVARTPKRAGRCDQAGLEEKPPMGDLLQNYADLLEERSAIRSLAQAILASVASKKMVRASGWRPKKVMGALLKWSSYYLNFDAHPSLAIASASWLPL